MSQANFGPYMECSLDLAVDLVNTLDPTDGDEQLTDPAALHAFLRDHEMSNAPTPTKRDLDEVRRVRERLRAVFGAADPKAASAILNELLAQADAKPVLTNHDGPWHLHYTPDGSPLGPRIAAESAMALSVIIAEDGFERLRSCDADDCQDVFVDVSRNRSRRYCSPQVCGNRASVAAYRARQRAAKAANRAR